MPSAVPPLKTGEPSASDWRAINRVAGSHNAVARGHADTRMQLDDQRRRPDGRLHRHPFQIYAFPPEYRSGTDDGTWWRRVLVRAGWVLGVAATGTDDADADPDGEDVGDPTHEITVPSGEACYWLWIERGTDEGGDPTATVRSGADPSLVGDAPWESYPVPDRNHIPIGYVDSTDTTNKLLRIRQYLRADVVTVGGSSGMNFRGEWSDAETYDQGDVVIYSTSGPGMGCYVATADGRDDATPPWEGDGWAKLPNGMGPWL